MVKIVVLDVPKTERVLRQQEPQEPNFFIKDRAGCLRFPDRQPPDVSIPGAFDHFEKYVSGLRGRGFRLIADGNELRVWGDGLTERDVESLLNVAGHIITILRREYRARNEIVVR